MIRVVGSPTDPGTHLENRVGEPSANPYLYLASNLIAEMDGIERALDPGPPTADPYADTGHVVLPRSLMDAVSALKSSTLFREKMGSEFIDYIVAIKEFEVARFLAYVTDWEHREYFEMF
jgi:glutamine synthetase